MCLLRWIKMLHCRLDRSLLLCIWLLLLLARLLQ
jgi:hypothetical protein